MQILKSKIKEWFIVNIIFIPIIIIYTILLYFEMIPNNDYPLRVISYLIGLVMFFIYGVISAKIESNKGWLAGLTSAIIAMFFIILGFLIFHNPLSLLLIGKLLSYLLISMVGGILGINFTINKKTLKR